MPFLLFADGRYAPVQGNNFIIGADAACDLTLTDEGVAPRQVILQNDGGRWRVATLNLHARTELNGDTLSNIAELHEGDSLRLGNATLVWSLKEPAKTHSRTTLWPLAAMAVAVLLLACVLAARLVYRPDEDARRVEATSPPPAAMPAAVAAAVPVPPEERSPYVSAPTYVIVVPRPVLPVLSPGKPPLYRLKIPPATQLRKLSVSHPIYRIKVVMPEDMTR